MRTQIKTFIAIVLIISILFCHIQISSIVKAVDLIETDSFSELEPEIQPDEYEGNLVNHASTDNALDCTLFSASQTVPMWLAGEMNIDGDTFSNYGIYHNAADVTMADSSHSTDYLQLPDEMYGNFVEHAQKSYGYNHYTDFVSVKQQNVYLTDSIVCDDGLDISANSDSNHSSDTEAFSYFANGFIESNGHILSSEDITITAEIFDTSVGRCIIIASKNGDITLRAKTININGIICAPNGSINIYCETANITGRIYGSTVKIVGDTVNIAQSTYEEVYFSEPIDDLSGGCLENDSESTFDIFTDNEFEYDNEITIEYPSKHEVRDSLLSQNNIDGVAGDTDDEYEPSDEVISFVQEYGLTPFGSSDFSELPDEEIAQMENRDIGDNENFDIVINGDVTITSSTSYSNKSVCYTGNVTVASNLSLTNSQVLIMGNLNINSGAVTVGTDSILQSNGDYRIQAYNSSTQEFVATNGYTKLRDGANLIVHGAFYTQSTVNTPFFEGASTLTLYGDFHQKGTDTYFYRALSGAGSSKTVFAGSATQNVTFEKTASSSTFVCVQYMKNGEGKLYFNTHIYYLYLLNSFTVYGDNVRIENLTTNAKSFTVVGNLKLTGSSDVSNLHIAEDENWDEYTDENSNRGNLTITGAVTFYSNAPSDVEGDVIAAGNVVLDSNAALTAYGAYRIQEYSSGEAVATNGYTKLRDGANLIVHGAFYTQSTVSTPFFEGASTLTLYGDFHQKGTDTYFYRALSGAGSSKTVFAGSATQNVTFEKTASTSTFVCVEYMKNGEGKLYFNTHIYYLYLLNSFTVYGDNVRIENLTTNAKSFTVVGNLKLVGSSDVSNLHIAEDENWDEYTDENSNRGNLTITGAVTFYSNAPSDVEGDVIAAGNVVLDSNAALTAYGAYRIQEYSSGEAVATNGYTKLRGGANLIVHGAFYTQSTVSTPFFEGASTLTLYGDFHQKGTDTYFYRAISGAGSSKTVFAGSGEQSVSFDRRDSSSTFIVVAQPMPTATIKLESAIYQIYAVTDINFVANSYSIDYLSVNGKAIHFTDSAECSASVALCGSVSLGNGSILCDENMILQNSAYLEINTGSVIVKGTLTLNSSSYFTINCSESANGMLFVYGDLINNSTHDIALTAGILDIKGNYIQSQATSVTAAAGVQVQFTGSNPQSILFPSNANVHFRRMAFAQVTSDSSGVLSPNLNYYTISSTPIWNSVVEMIDSFILSQLIIAGLFGQSGTNLATGNYSQTIEDLNVQTAIGQIKLSHSYNSLDGSDGILGKCFSLSHNMRLTFTENNGINYVSATLPGGSVKSFVQNTDGTYVASNARATLVAEDINGTVQYTVSDPTNTKVVFDSDGHIRHIEDNKGNRLNFETDPSSGNITRMYDSTGTNVTLTYNDGKLTAISDCSTPYVPITASFSYDSYGRLSTSTNMNGITIHYEYQTVDEGEEPSGLLTVFKNANNQVIENVEYIDNFGIVSKVTNARGVVFTYSYGDKTRFYSSITDTNGRVTGQTYDGSRNITSSHNAAGEIVQATYQLDEDGINRYGEIASQTDERGNTTSYTRDENGNVTLITYPNGSTESYEYDANNNVTKHIDRDGKTTFYIYDGNLLIEAAVRLSGSADYTPNDRNNPNFAVTTYTYYAVSNSVIINGLVHTETSPSGAVTTYTYDTRGHVMSKTYGSGNTAYSVSYTYDSRGNVVTETDSDGVVTIYEYNANGFLTKKSVTPPNGTTRVVEKYAYDSLGRKVQEQNAQQFYEGVSTRYTYNTAGDVLTMTLHISNTLEYVTAYEYDSYGNVTKEMLPTGSYTVYTYDNLNRKKNTFFYDHTTQQTKLLQSIAYANSGTSIVVTTTDYTGENVAATTVETYNFENNLISKIIKNGSDVYATYLYTYTAGGKVSTETDPYGNTTTYKYDTLGNITEITSPFDGANFTHTYRTYDKAGNMTQERIQNNIPGDNESTARTDYRYDVWGNLITTILYDGNSVKSVARYVYDNKNQLVCEYRGLSSLSTEVTTNYTMTTGRPDLAYSMTTYTYNEFGELAGSIDPMGKSESYTYFNSGELHTYTDKNGSVTTYAYDKLGEVASETVTKQDCTTIAKTFLYDVVGNLTELVQTIGGASESTHYTYDGMGNTLTETTGNITKTYTYDRAGNVLTATVTNGDELTEQFTYAYDFLGRLHQVRDDTTLKATYTYDVLSRLTKTTYANGVTEENVYNNAGLITSVVNKNGEEVLSFYEYTYYLNGNQRSKTDSSGETVYEYNDRGYLTRTTYPDASYDAYAYDANGNRTEKLSVSQETVNDHTIYTYDNNDRLTQKQSTVPEGNRGNLVLLLNTEPELETMGIETTVWYTTDYTYDNNGNMLGSVYEEGESYEIVTEQTFDLLNRMISFDNGADEAEYSYYPNNQRKNKVVTRTTNRPLEGGAEMMAFDSGGETTQTTTMTHIWMGDEIALDIVDEDVVKYTHGLKLIESTYGTYVYDGHGNVTQLLGSDLTVAHSYEYDSFGKDLSGRTIEMAEEMSMSGGDEPLSGYLVQRPAFLENPYRYCGEYLDIETGYVYLRARYYDPNLGRFISEDSAKDGYNWYVYCGNDPINRIDPSGKFAITTLLAIALSSIAVGMWYDEISQLESNGGDWASVDVNSVVSSGLVSGTVALMSVGVPWATYGFAQTVAVSGALGVAGQTLHSMAKGVVPTPNELASAGFMSMGTSAVGYGINRAVSCAHMRKASPINRNINNISTVKLPNQGVINGDTPDAPLVDAGKQGKHVPGHNNYVAGKSYWANGSNGVNETQLAWKYGYILEDGTRVWNSGRMLGANGETAVRVHMDGRGNIHGYPVEYSRYFCKRQ